MYAIRKTALLVSLLFVFSSIFCPAAALAQEPQAQEQAASAVEEPADDAICLDLTESDDLDALAGQYAGQFNGADVRLKIKGAISSIVTFLSNFTFHSLELDMTPVSMATDFNFGSDHLSDIPGLTAVKGIDGAAMSFSLEDVYEDLEDLSLIQQSSSPHIFGRVSARQMPALKHLTLIFKDPSLFNDTFGPDALRHALLPSTLESIDLIVEDAAVSMEEPGTSSLDKEPLSRFIGILLGNCPDAVLNGAKLADIPASLKDAVNPEIISNAVTNAYISSVYDEASNYGSKITYSSPAPLYGKILFALARRYDGITETSAVSPEQEEESGEDNGFYSDIIPPDMLSSGLEDADMLVIIYENSIKVGFYTYGGSAYQVDTMVAVNDLNTGAIYEPIIAASNDPPSSITVKTVNGVPLGGSGYGDFEPETALSLVLDLYDSSIPGKADMPSPEPSEAGEEIPVPNVENAYDGEFLDAVLAALDNPVYADTLAALQGGETIAYGAVSPVVSGLQQTLVDMGCDIAVDSSAGPGTFSALNSSLAPLGKENVTSVDAALYAELLPLLLIIRDTDGEYDTLLRAHYETEGESGKYEYLKGCTYYAQGRYYKAFEAFADSEYQDYEERMAACEQPWPSDGELWHNNSVYGSDMLLSFQVNSFDESEGMLFEVYTQDGILASSLFVTGSGSVSTYLPGGSYRIKDCSGKAWYGARDAFGRHGHYEYMSFYEVDEDPYLTILDPGYEWIITVNVTEGNPDATGVGSVDSDWETWTAE